MPAPSDREKSHLEFVLPGRSLLVSTSDDGRMWGLEVAYTERDGTRTWWTQATVSDAGDADVIALQTSCSGTAAPPVVAPPRLLGAWVQGLDLQDAGIPVLGEPRMVGDEVQLTAFCDHLASSARRLPVIALMNKPGSRYYGVDPRGLAEAVRGLAHVTCIASEMADVLAGRLPKPLAAVPGAARIYQPGFQASAPRTDHPLVRNPSRTGPADVVDQGAFRRLLCRRICDMSAAAARQLVT